MHITMRRTDDYVALAQAWLKMHTAPNPFTFALVLACVLADVSLTLIQLFPYDYYTSGLLFMLVSVPKLLTRERSIV